MIKTDFEQSAVNYVIAIARIVKDEYRYLLSTSSICARTPDLDVVWHPGFMSLRSRAMRCYYLFKLLKGLVMFGWRMLIHKPGLYYKFYGQPMPSLLVMPDVCGQEVKGVWRSDYISTLELDAVLVFGNNLKSFSPSYQRVSRREILRIAIELTGAGMVVLLSSVRRGLKDQGLLFLMWMSWVWSLSWVESLALSKVLTQRFEQHPFNQVGSVHEMHAWVRAIWCWAKRNHVKGYALQHACIAEGKRWYFIDQEEYKYMPAFPERMIVFNQRDKQLLEKCLPETTFSFGYSKRYSYLQAIREPLVKGERILFCGGLSWFDNEILLNGLRQLLVVQPEVLVTIRLHPFARLSLANKKFVNQILKYPNIQRSKVSLMEDLITAKLVVGVGTTIIQEALAVGKPALQLLDKKYHDYLGMQEMPGFMRMNVNNLDFKDVFNDGHVNMKIARSYLGLEHKEITYQELFK